MSTDQPEPEPAVGSVEPQIGGVVLVDAIEDDATKPILVPGDGEREGMREGTRQGMKELKFVWLTDWEL